MSFHFLENGVYDQRRNAAEADYIAQLVRGLLSEDAGHSIGIIAFSEAQQTEIEQALKRLAREDDEFRDRLEAEWEREDDGQFVGLLVKNLENIQGDERDVIILSVCYGHGPTGKMLMNFGPINQNGGERRLNVAFSRQEAHGRRVVDSPPRHHQRLQRRGPHAQELSALTLRPCRPPTWKRPVECCGKSIHPKALELASRRHTL